MRTRAFWSDEFRKTHGVALKMTRKNKLSEGPFRTTEGDVRVSDSKPGGSGFDSGLVLGLNSGSRVRHHIPENKIKVSKATRPCYGERAGPRPPPVPYGHIGRRKGLGGGPHTDLN